MALGHCSGWVGVFSDNSLNKFAISNYTKIISELEIIFWTWNYFLNLKLFFELEIILWNFWNRLILTNYTTKIYILTFLKINNILSQILIQRLGCKFHKKIWWAFWIFWLYWQYSWPVLSVQRPVHHQYRLQ